MKWNSRPTPTIAAVITEALAIGAVGKDFGSVSGGVAAGEGEGEGDGVGGGLGLMTRLLVNSWAMVAVGINETVGSHVSNERSVHVGN